jgi:hypothetical protein
MMAGSKLMARLMADTTLYAHMRLLVCDKGESDRLDSRCDFSDTGGLARSLARWLGGWASPRTGWDSTRALCYVCHTLKVPALKCRRRRHLHAFVCPFAKLEPHIRRVCFAVEMHAAQQVPSVSSAPPFPPCPSSFSLQR